MATDPIIISSYAYCKAQPMLACARILSKEGLEAWWIGRVRVQEMDPNWPAAETKMTWKAGGGVFKARIKTDARPLYVEMAVDTPSADSIIRHTFEERPGGGTRYTKSVMPVWRPGFARFLSPLLILILRAFVKREVRKAARYADIL